MYLLITVGYAVLASVAVVAAGRGGVAAGGSMNGLKCAPVAARECRSAPPATAEGHVLLTHHLNR